MRFQLPMFLALYTPWFWFGVAVVCVVVEGMTLGLTTVWFALSAVLMIFISMLHPPFYVQCVLFALVALLLLFFTRPLAVKFLHAKREKTNADSLIGKKALVLQTITEWEKGQVKINGAVWTAASVDGTALPAGEECIIERIEGVTLIVKETDASENRNV